MDNNILKEELNNLLEDLFLDENLPRDLAKAYKNFASAEVSTSAGSHPSTNHGELGRSDIDRRFVKWDYGKSNYEALTPDEARAYVNQDIHNIENLRIILDGDLLEYGVKPDGRGLYAIYRNRDKAFTIDGKQYRNIGFVVSKSVILNQIFNMADKIYKTDEYEHPLSAEEINKRTQKKNNIDVLGKVNKIDPHNPHKSFLDASSLKVVPEYPDTGAHKFEISDLGKNSKLAGYANQENPSNRTNIYINSYFNPLIRALKQKKSLYIEFDQVRRALKKLEADKEDYDEDEYNTLKAKWEDRKNTLAAEYNEAAKEAANLKSKYIIYIDDKSRRCNQALNSFTATLETVMTKIQDLGLKILSIEKETAKNELSANYRYSNSLRDYKRRLASLNGELVDAYNRLKELQNEANNIDNLQISDAENSVTELNNSIDNLYSEMNEFRKEVLANHLSKLNELQADLEAAMQEYLDLKPREAERKARNAARNNKELDSRLVDIIDFAE